MTHNFNNYIRKGALLTAALASALSTLAMPAKRGWTVLRQSDGSEITIALYGDEHKAMYESADGYLLMPDSLGDLRYAVRDTDGRIRPSSVMATNTPDAMTETFKATIDRDNVKAAYAVNATQTATAIRRAQSLATTGTSHKITDYPAQGTQKVLVILARFADIDFYTPNIGQAIDRMLNEKGYSDNGATGSVRDYFIDNSCGQYQPQMMIYGPVTLPQNMAYYGAPTDYATDARPAEMIRDACRLLDDEIDFKEYDLDGDGVIDNVYLFYPGYSQADGASPNTIWPHAGLAWSQTLASFDGVKLDHYACSNEIDFGTNNLVSIGTFCHEFTHVLGLPDLYATDYSHKSHPGTWSLMADGGRNNDGKTPPCMSAYERYTLGWITPEKLKPTTSLVELPSISDNKAYIYESPSSANEFFLIENRVLDGWDSYLPGHGMLVWHIDYDAQLWTKNIANNDVAHQHIDLVEADELKSATRAGNAFPGSTDVRSITDATSPSLRDWSGASGGIGIYNIRETDSATVVFNVINTTGSIATPYALSATDATPVSFTAHWEKVEGADSYVIDVYTKQRIGSAMVKTYLPDYRVLVIDNATSLEVTGLQPSTTYYYSVRAMGNTFISDYSNETEITTSDKDFRFFAPETDAPADVTDTSFTARWKSMNDAREYYVSVYEVTEGEKVTYANDFSAETVTPAGWNASPACAVSKFYGGAAKPAMTMGGNLFIQSPADERDITSARFWCRGLASAWDDVNEIRLSGYYGQGEWIDLGTIWPISTDKDGETYSLSADDFETPVHSFRIEFNRPYGSGTLVVDDIEVTHSHTTATVLDEYTNRTAGQNLNLTVTGLKPGTLYRYVVTASDGMLKSMASRPRQVRTTGSTSIAGITQNSDVTIACDGLSVNVTNNSDQTVTAQIYNIAGQSAGTISVMPNSSNSITLPTAGLYIIKTPQSVTKVIL